ncbi:MAG TPA: hypothetical protein VLT79_08545 [Gemmatimonadales bacterium]|nr:hypothetical protein [Gemmatimonadales bacterium]
MNWKLVAQLSLFGLAMGLATVFAIPSNIEPVFWLVVFGISAYFLATRTSTPFRHGVLVGIANSVWVTASHVLFVNRYIATHPQEAGMMKSMPLPDSPRFMMVMAGLGIGVVSGIVIGLLALLATKLVRSRTAPSTAG